jgi:hypothetical protein
LRVPAGLGGRLRALSAKIDEGFCALPHPMGKDGAFLAVTSTRRESAEDESTTLWEARYGALTTAQVAMMCVSRYDNDGAPKFLELIVGAADAYAGKLPSEAADVWPGTLGQAISLQLAAWRHTARESYLAEARRLADWAVAMFFDGGQALPRASRKSEHYESITGGDTLALALLELHLHILHITAVRCPQNTLDR